MDAFHARANSILEDVSRHLEPVARWLPDVVTQHPRFTVAAVAVGLSAIWARRNYLEFKALGRGGLPSNTRGWFVAVFLKLFARDTVSTGEYDRDPNKDAWIEGKDEIPIRQGPRPGRGFHVAPARQSDQIPNEEMMVLLNRFFKQLVEENLNLVETSPSPHERMHDGVMIKSSIPPPHEVAVAALREIAHFHPIDHSMHVMLAPQDCKLVIERGWGERHQLSGSAGLHALPVPPNAKLPKEYIWIYAPRDLQELAVVEKIIVAGIKYMTGSKDVNPATVANAAS